MAPSSIDPGIRVTYAGGVRAPKSELLQLLPPSRTRHNQLALVFQAKGRDRDGHSGRSTFETIHEVRLKQFCARVRDGLSKPVNREELRRAAGPATPAALFFPTCRRHARRGSRQLAMVGSPAATHHGLRAS